MLAEQHVYRLEQGSNALNFQEAGFGRAAQEYERAALDEVHVAVAQATEICRGEVPARMGALERQAGSIYGIG